MIKRIMIFKGFVLFSFTYGRPNGLSVLINSLLTKILRPVGDIWYKDLRNLVDSVLLNVFFGHLLVQYTFVEGDRPSQGSPLGMPYMLDRMRPQSRMLELADCIRLGAGSRLPPRGGPGSLSAFPGQRFKVYLHHINT